MQDPKEHSEVTRASDPKPLQKKDLQRDSPAVGLVKVLLQAAAEGSPLETFFGRSWGLRSGETTAIFLQPEAFVPFNRLR